MLGVLYKYCECFISIASVLSVLRVFYQCCEYFIKKQIVFEFSSTSILYQSGIVCSLFSSNPHTSMLAAGTRLLAYTHRVHGP